jgi:hypothetical protein
MKLETLSLSLPDKRAWNDGAGWRWDKDKARAAESRRVFRERMLAAALDLVPEEMRDGPAWELGTDGVGTQQNGDGWQMSLRRFIPATSND